MDRPGRSPRGTARLLVLALLGAGCGGVPPVAVDHNEVDPAVAAALNDQLMTDPDLAAQNGGDAALEGGGVVSAAIPTPERGTDEIARSRAEALALLGGNLRAPPPRAGKPLASETVATSAALALAGTPRARCVAQLDYSFAWAALMPAQLPIYPRAAVHEAAGVEQTGCRLRAINYRTPVTVEDAAAFHFASASDAGYRLENTMTGEGRALVGRNGDARVFVLIRPGPDRLTEVDLVTSAG